MTEVRDIKDTCLPTALIVESVKKELVTMWFCCGNGVFKGVFAADNQIKRSDNRGLVWSDPNGINGTQINAEKA